MLKIKPHKDAPCVAEIRFSPGEAVLSPNEARQFMLLLHDNNLSHMFEVRYPLIDDQWREFHPYPLEEEVSWTLKQPSARSTA